MREYIISKGGSYAGCFEKRDLVETAEKCTGKLFRHETNTFYVLYNLVYKDFFKI